MYRKLIYAVSLKSKRLARNSFKLWR